MKTIAQIDPAARALLSCKNCDAELVAGAQFCSNCGQKISAHRLTLHEIFHDGMHALLHVDRSVLSLIRALLVRPGKVSLDYVSGRRRRYYGPFAFLVVMVALASAAIAMTGFTVISSGDTPSAVVNFLQHHINILFLAQMPVLAAAMRFLSPRGPFNYAEYLVLASYTGGMHILFITLVNVGGGYLLKLSIHASQLFTWGSTPVWAFYLAVAIAQFLGGSKFLAGIKAVATIAIGYAVTQLVVNSVANLEQLLTGH